MTSNSVSGPSDPVGAVHGRLRGADELVSLIGAGLHATGEQRRVIEAPFGPTLVVAGAGSGKTHTLALRFLYLLDHASVLAGRDLAPDEILCLTFTRKAAGEIAERVTGYLDKAFGADPHRPLPAVSTYNAYAAGLVAEHGLRIGIDPESVVLTDAALWQMASRVAEEWAGDLAFDGSLSTAATAVSSLAAALADHGRVPADLAHLLEGLTSAIEALPLGPKQRTDKEKRAAAAKSRARASLAALVERFVATKRAGSSLDFSDQIAFARELATITSVRSLERVRFSAVLLDEYQDTSPGQIDLLRSMFGGEVPVMAVGDPNQAIYGFRGASEGALAGFVDDFGGGVGERLTLSVSWRNSTEVLRAANAVTEPLRNATRVPVPVLTSRFGALGMTERERDDPSVTARVFRDAAEEAAGVVDALLERRAALDASREQGERGVETAILCRVRRQFPLLVAALRRAGVEFQVVGLGGLLDTPAVVDLVALLEVAHDPSRGDSLMRLLSGERMVLGIRDIAALGDWAEELAGPRDSRDSEPSIVDALFALPVQGWVSRDGRSIGAIARDRLGRLCDIVGAIRSHTYLPVAELVSFAARSAQLDIEANIAARAQGRAQGDEALDALVEAARTFSSGIDHATLGGFLSWLDAAREREDGLDSPVEVPRPGAVQVMTVHAAKGMEWDLVAVPGLSDGVFPNVGVSGELDEPVYRWGGWLENARHLPWPLRRDAALLPEWKWEGARDFKEFQASEQAFRVAAGAHAIQEERRLFYVALTRARSDVILTASWIGEGIAVRPVSLYVRELVDLGIVSADGWAPRPKDGRGAEEGGAAEDAAETEAEFKVAPVSWPTVPSAVQGGRMAFAAEVLAALARGQVAGGEELPHELEIEAMLAEDRKDGSAASSVVLPAHLTSTALVALARDRESFALAYRRPIPQEPAPSARRGSAFHAWAEAYFNRPALVDVDDWLDDDGGPRGSSLAEGDEVARLCGSFLASEWAGRRPTAIEANVEVPVGGVILRCRIDAVFPVGDGLDRVTVVDWKTGGPPQDAKDRAAREVQLAVYRLAWSAWRGIPLEAVDALFFYVATGQTVRPERLMVEEEIVRLLRGD